MSVSLILQDENKKTLGGYLWIFLTLSTVITLHISNYDFSEMKSIMNFISVYILLASFLSLALITIRPETLFNRVLFRDKKIPPYFVSTDNLSIIEIIQSPLLAKERDNFWGNILIGIGFITAIFIPLDKIIESEFFIFLEITKILIASLAAIIIVGNWYYIQKKDLINKIEIIWRYMEMLSQMGWKEYYTEQIKALKDSLKLRLWKKAEYQVNELKESYRNDLGHIKDHTTEFNQSYQFLLCEAKFSSTFLKFNFDDLKKFYDRARILGMEYHDLSIYTNLTLRINEFQYLHDEFRKNFSLLKDRHNHLMNTIHNSNTIRNKSDHFKRLLGQLDYNLYHIKPTDVDFPEFDNLKKYASESQEEDLIKWFEEIGNTTNFCQKFTADFREAFNKEVKNKLSRLGEHPAEAIENSINGIYDWINNFLESS